MESASRVTEDRQSREQLRMPDLYNPTISSQRRLRTQYLLQRVAGIPTYSVFPIGQEGYHQDPSLHALLTWGEVSQPGSNTVPTMVFISLLDPTAGSHTVTLLRLLLPLSNLVRLSSSPTMTRWRTTNSPGRIQQPH